MNYKFGLPVEIIFKCGAVKNIDKVIKDNNLFDLTKKLSTNLKKVKKISV